MIKFDEYKLSQKETEVKLVRENLDLKGQINDLNTENEQRLEQAVKENIDLKVKNDKVETMHDLVSNELL